MKMKRSAANATGLAGRRWIAAGLVLVALGWVGQPSLASETCREWWREHQNWKAKALAFYLSDASQRELDAAMFEVVQLEAYLTVCEGAPPGKRARLVSQRTVGRPVDEYAATVAESLLEQAGLDLSLESVLMPGEHAQYSGVPARESFRAAAQAAR
jgi:hypothetical protein